MGGVIDGLAQEERGPIRSRVVARPGRGLPLTDVACSPDGRYVLTVSRETAGQVWDVLERREVRRLAWGGHDPDGFAFAPDAMEVATGGADGTVRLWDLARGTEIRRFAGPSRGVLSVAFSADGRSVLTGGWETACLWCRATGAEVLRLEGHDRAVFFVAFGAEGRVAVTASGDVVRFFELSTGREINRVSWPREASSGNDYRLLWAGLSPDGREVWTFREDSCLERHDAATGDWRSLTRMDGFGSDHRLLAASPDGSTILIARRQDLRLLHGKTGHLIRRLEASAIAVTSATFAPDARHVLTASPDGATIWTTADGRERCRLIAFPDGTWAVVDTEGHYDSSHDGQVEGLVVLERAGSRPVSGVGDPHYEPGLLPRVLGH